MKKIIVILLFIVSLTQIFAQSQSDSIIIEKGRGLHTSYHGVYELTPKQICVIIISNKEAAKEIEKASVYSNIGDISKELGEIILFVAFIIFVFAFIGNKKTKSKEISQGKAKLLYYSVGIFAIFSVLSIPLNLASNKHAKNAIIIYNKGLKQNSMNKVDLK